VLLVGKARHRIVGLMRELRPPDAPFGGSAECRKVRASCKMMNQRGREDRLAGAGKPRDAKAKGGLDNLA
jgi:hypothetical protein